MHEQRAEKESMTIWQSPELAAVVASLAALLIAYLRGLPSKTRLP